MLSTLFNEQNEGLVYEFIARVPSYIGTYQLDIHTDLLAADFEVKNLTSRDLLHAFLEQVHTIFPVVIHCLLSEKLVSGRRRRGGIIRITITTRTRTEVLEEPLSEE